MPRTVYVPEADVQKPSSSKREAKRAPRRSLIRDFFYIVSAIVSVLYLLNLDMGVFELLPDNLPIIGNLDEAAFTLLLLKSLAHFGLPTGLSETIKRFGKNKGRDRE